METTARGNPPSTFGMSNNTEGILDKASSSAHAAVDSIAGAADEAARKAKSASDQVAAMAHQVVDKAAGAAAPAADCLSEQGESLAATQKKLVRDTRSYVKTNPLTSVGIAVAVGFLVSRIMVRSGDMGDIIVGRHR